MTAITATTPSNLRKNLFTLLNSVTEHGTELIVTMKSGKNAVLISEDELNSYRETDYLLGNAANRERLLLAVKHIKENQALKSFSLEEFEKLQEELTVD